MDQFGKGLGSLIPGSATPSPHLNPLPPNAPEQSSVRGRQGERKKEQILPPHEAEEGDVFRAQEINPDRIDPNPSQPRTTFDEASLQELKESIKQYGILEPLIVTEKADGRFELIAGERRLRCAKLLTLKKVPVVVRHADDLEKLELALIENLQRQDLNPIEEAQSYKELRDGFGLSQDEVARRVGKSRETVSNALRMLELAPEIQKAIGSGTISPAHARILLSIDNPKIRGEVFQGIVAKGMSVREAKEAAAPKMRRKRASLQDPSLLADETRLREQLNTKVQIEKRGERGKITVHFYSDEDYRELIGKLGGE